MQVLQQSQLSTNSMKFSGVLLQVLIPHAFPEYHPSVNKVDFFQSNPWQPGHGGRFKLWCHVPSSKPLGFKVQIRQVKVLHVLQDVSIDSIDMLIFKSRFLHCRSGISTRCHAWYEMATVHLSDTMRNGFVSSHRGSRGVGCQSHTFAIIGGPQWPKYVVSLLGTSWSYTCILGQWYF